MLSCTMDIRLPSFEITIRGEYCPQLLPYDGIKMNEMRKRGSLAVCGSSLHSLTSSSELSKHLQAHLQAHLQKQRCGTNTVVSFD